MNNTEQDHLVWQHSLLTDYDIYLFKQGKHYQLADYLGAHKMTIDDQEGYHFAVFAPGAWEVCGIGEFNGWDGSNHKLFVRWDESGIWEGFIPGVKDQTIYKYQIRSNHTPWVIEKSDPFAFHCETPPKTGSITWNLKYNWKDKRWLNKRAKMQSFEQPMSIYEVHLGSWRRNENNNYQSYRDLAQTLVPYVKEMGFTHIEFMPKPRPPLSTGRVTPS